MKTTKPTEVIRATFLFTLAVGLLVPSGGDAQTLGNPEFSTPPLGGAFYQYSPSTNSDQPWTFGVGCGIARAGGGADTSFAIAEPNYPGQYAFLQLVGTSVDGRIISQTVSFSSAGRFTISFLEAGRIVAPSGAGGDLNYKVEVRPSQGGISVLSATYTSATAQPFTARAQQFSIATAGDYTLSFAALSHNGPYNDNAALIDHVSLERLPDDDLLATIHLSDVSAVDICWAGRTNRMYGVQYRTNLSDTNWYDFGSPVLGTGVNCVSDSINGMEQRFYRIFRLP